MPYILALDQGTTSSRAIVFDHDGRVKAVVQQEVQQIFPRPGWVEHDPNEIWSSQINVAREVLGRAHVGSRDLAAVGITNQRETTVVWDRETGQPIYNAIVWQDRRTASICDELKADGCETDDPATHRAGDRRVFLRQQDRAGFSTTCRERANRRRPGRWPLARSTVGWCGSSPAGEHT